MYSQHLLHFVRELCPTDSEPSGISGRSDSGIMTTGEYSWFFYDSYHMKPKWRSLEGGEQCSNAYNWNYGPIFDLTGIILGKWYNLPVTFTGLEQKDTISNEQITAITMCKISSKPHAMVLIRIPNAPSWEQAILLKLKRLCGLRHVMAIRSQKFMAHNHKMAVCEYSTLRMKAATIWNYTKKKIIKRRSTLHRKLRRKYRFIRN